MKQEKQAYCEPAAAVIEKAGGPERVAAIVGVDSSRVRRWRQPKNGDPNRGGGQVPWRAAYALVGAGVVEPEDFFPVELVMGDKPEE